MILRLVSRRPWGALRFLGLILVLGPVGAWYKHVASPRYHTVGRASGLLMGVSRSPYLLRRALEGEPRQSLAAASSLPANRASPQWLMPAGAEPGPWTTLEHRPLGAQGALGKGRASKRALLRQASPRTRVVRNLWAALQHHGAAWASRCPSGCEGTPWRSPSPYPERLKRALRKKEPPNTTQEARAFRPEM